MLATRYDELETAMEQLADGDRLRSTAGLIVKNLPATGKLVLVATSTHGAALAAVCSALRSAPTRWMASDLLSSRGRADRLRTDCCRRRGCWPSVAHRSAPPLPGGTDHRGHARATWMTVQG